MPKPDKIKFLIVHTSDSKWGSVADIRKWHTDPPPQGRGWADIGYHYVITNQFPSYNALKLNKPDATTDGVCWPGRDIDHDGDIDEELGAHCIGYNDKSLGICVVGAHGVYTNNQMLCLYATCIKLMEKYNIPLNNVLGHYETASGKAEGKTCPDIDMQKFRESLSFAGSVHTKLKNS